MLWKKKNKLNRIYFFNNFFSLVLHLKNLNKITYLASFIDYLSISELFFIDSFISLIKFIKSSFENY